jgi:hypothetical protein
MGFEIQDGTGNGFIAEVTSENRLAVESKVREEEGVEAQLGKAFILHARCHLAAAASGGLIYFTNNSNVVEFMFSRLYFDAFTLTTPIIITQVQGPASVSGGTDISLTGIVQKNFGSALSLDATLVASDGSSDMTYTGGIHYHAFVMNSLQSTMRHMAGTNVITPNKTIVWGWEALTGNATDGEIISLSLNGYTRAIGS